MIHNISIFFGEVLAGSEFGLINQDSNLNVNTVLIESQSLPVTDEISICLISDEGEELVNLGSLKPNEPFAIVRLKSPFLLLKNKTYRIKIKSVGTINPGAYLTVKLAEYNE